MDRKTVGNPVFGALKACKAGKTGFPACAGNAEIACSKLEQGLGVLRGRAGLSVFENLLGQDSLNLKLAPRARVCLCRNEGFGTLNPDVPNCAWG